MRRFFWEPSFVVLKQQPPGAGVLLYDFQNCPALVGDERVVGECSGKQAYRLLDLVSSG